MTSTFDFPLQQIYYVDNNGGKWQSSGELASGRKTQLIPCPDNRFDEWLKEQRRQLSNDGRNRLKLVANRRGHFLAQAEEGPFTETLKSLSWQESSALITGPVVTP